MITKPALTQTPIAPLIANRWSGRAFDAQRDLAHSDLIALLEAARWAPSCYGEQPWRFIVWQKSIDHEKWQLAFNCLANANQVWAETAPLLMLCCAHRIFSHNASPNRWSEYDSGAASENLCLQATHLGLMAHQMGGFDADAIRTSFSIPDDYMPMAMLVVGYPAPAETLGEESLVQRELAARIRRPLDSTFFAGTWGQGIQS